MKQLVGDTSTRILLLIALLAALVLVFLTLHILLVPLVAASFVAYLLEPGIEVLERRGFKRGNAFLLLLALGFVVLVMLLDFAPSWLRPERTRESSQNLTERVQQQVDEIERSLESRIPLTRSLNLADKVTVGAAAFATRIFEELPSLVTSFAVNLLLVPFIAYFIIRDGRTMRRRIVEMVPNRYFEMTLMMFYRIDKQIGGYLRGRLIECTLVALTQMIAMGIALLFVPLPQILLISCVCGATNLIPYVGPVLGVSFGALLYLGAGLPMTSVYALIVAALVAHIIDNIAIAPAVLSHNVDLHPLTVALVLVIGGETLGVLGLLIAIPVAASLKVIVQEFYANYRLQVRA